MINALEELFQSKIIVGTILITDSFESSLEISKILMDNNHSVSVFHAEGALQQFYKKESRIFVCTYTDWYKNKNTIQMYVSAHNLMLYDKLDSQQQYIIDDWIENAKTRGFFKTGLPYYRFQIREPDDEKCV